MHNPVFSEQNPHLFARLKDVCSKEEECVNPQLKAWRKRLGVGEHSDALAQFRNAEHKLQTEATGELAQKLHLDRECDILARFGTAESAKQTLPS